MSDVGNSGVANRANTSTGYAENVNAVVVESYPLGRGVGGSGVISQLYPANPSLVLNFTNTGTLDPRITFTRTTTATCTNASGLLESVAINAPRFDYNPTTLAPLGLLIEEQRVNLLLYSEELDTGWTNATGATWQYNSGVSPAGTTTALGVNGLAGTGLVSTGTTLYRVGTAISGSTAYTFSVYVRTKTGTANIALRMSETGGNNTVAPGVIVTTAWTRLSMSVTSAAGATSVTIAVGTASGTADAFIWGAQLEAGAFPTSYIPTVASQVTRAADAASMTGANFSSWYNQAQGTLFAEASANWTLPVNGVLTSLNNGSTINRLRTFFRSTITSPANRLSVYVSNNAITTANIGDLLLPTEKANSKICYAYQGTALVGTKDGAVVTVGTSGAFPVFTQLSIGSDAGAANPFCGHIQQLAYYPRRLANSELQAITA